MSKTGNANSILGDVSKKKSKNANAMFADIKKETALNLKNREADVVIEVETENVEIKELESNNSKVESTSIYELDPDLLIPFRDEKLRLDLHSGDAYERLKESIAQNGIVNPIIVMNIKDDLKHYEIIAGHNRVQVCKDLGIKVPCIIKHDITIEEANKICIDTNLLNRQRSEFKPTQFAYMLKVRFEKEKQQGSSAETDSGTKLGEQYSLDRRTIFRYIKLNNLTDTAKQAVDSNKITLRVAYELAFLPEDLQNFIVDNYDKYKINDTVIKQLKQHIKQNPPEDPEELLKYAKFYLPTKNANKRQFDYRNIKPYIPANVEEDKLEEYVIKALEFYNKSQN